MATIVRIKRRRNEDPLDSVIISCKKRKEDNHPVACSEPSEPQSSLKFAGTVSSKVEGISKQIRDAIRKEKLQKQYKQHTVDVTSKNRQRQKQAAQNGRLKIISSLRNIELEQLDRTETDKDGDKCKDSTQISQSNERLNVSNSAISTGACGQNGEKHTFEKDSCSDGCTGGGGNCAAEKLYQLLDVEIDSSKPLPTFEALLKESQSAKNVTCNSVPLVNEKVKDQEEDFVYDLYYTNNQEFNFKALVSDLTVQMYDDELIFADNRNFTNEEIYEDEDDSNDEDNWRNDYPDEDPQFYENEDTEYHYGDDDRDNAAFDHVDPELVQWMSSRCTIDDDVSDEEIGSSYDRYYRMIKREMDQVE